jgi:hypothetical protein
MSMPSGVMVYSTRGGILADAFDLFHDAREAEGRAGFGEDGHGPERPFVGEACNHFAGEGVVGFGLGVAEFLSSGPAGILVRVFFHGYLEVPTR